VKKRSDKNSVISAVVGFAGVIDDAILPHAGVELRSNKEHLIWSKFTDATEMSPSRNRMKPEQP